MKKATYFLFLLSPKSLNGTKAMEAMNSRTRFLMKVWKLVRWITSPKHPQSMAGLKIARKRVSTVKNPSRTVVMTATAFLQTPLISAAPRSASSRAKATATTFAAGIRKPRWRNLKYSSTTSPAPTGSSSLNMPARRKTIPMMKEQSLLSL